MSNTVLVFLYFIIIFLILTDSDVIAVNDCNKRVSSNEVIDLVDTEDIQSIKIQNVRTVAIDEFENINLNKELERKREIKSLEDRICLIKRNIDRTEQAEVNLDADHSAYIECDRFVYNNIIICSLFSFP